MNKPIVWYVDENEQQSRTYRNALRMLLPNDVEVKAIYPPYREKQEYLALLEDPATACIILDQKLKEAGTANYTGIELARYLRSVNQKIPIYILTNYATEEEEFSGSSWSVEQIIDKGDLNSDELSEVIKARILRNINIYEDVLGKREARFRDLLRRSLQQELNESELQELEDLQFERSIATIASEFAEQSELGKLIEINEELLKLLSQRTSNKDN